MLQYSLSMISVQLDPLDNGRYPDLEWTSARDVLAAMPVPSAA